MKATRRKAKPGQVLFFYGRIPHEGTDHIGMHGGSGATNRHMNLVMHNFTMKKSWHGLDDAPKSFIDELDAAGFDTTTIQFSIQMKEPTP